VAALVAASQVAFVGLRVAGAVVLVVLGVRAWRAAWRDRGIPSDAPPAPPATGGWWRALGEGALVQLANPKAAVFMGGVLPAARAAGRPLFATTALLALLQVALEIVLYLSLAAGVARAGSWFRRTTVQRRLDAITGTVLVGPGVRVTVDGR